MNILYKYYSSNFNLREHLKRPLIKLSHPKTFNDPFESFIPNELAENISLDYFRTYLTEEYFEFRGDDYLERKIEQLKKYYMDAPASYGVISLTETHRNILMWAHYANSHRGVCIGYKTDFLSSQLDEDVYDPYHNHVDLKPQRVLYDSKRFDIEDYIRKSQDYRVPFKKVFDSMTIKSNEWIYEKEHRCIIPYEYAENIKFINTPSPLFSKSIERMLKRGLINKGKTTLEYERGDFRQLSDYGRLNKFLSRVAKSEEAIVLKSFNERKIESIYFGCEHDKQKQKRICDYIEKDKERLGHIKVYKYQINRETFGMDEIRIL